MTTELIIRYVKVLIVFVLLWVGIWAYNNYGCRRLDGAEMAPTFPPGNYVVRPKIRTPDQLQHDDVVSYTVVVGGKVRDVAGRVIGLPGDRVRIEKGEVYRNGNKIGSSYVGAQQRTTEDYAEVVVPRDSVFILCDARRASSLFDSRGVGPVGQWAITGRFK
jgi:signal peptidase I